MTNKQKIEALKELYKLKAEYHKEEIVKEVTGGFSDTSAFSVALNIADVIQYIAKVNNKEKA